MLYWPKVSENDNTGYWPSVTNFSYDYGTNVMLTNVGYGLSENYKCSYLLSDNDKSGYWLSDNDKAGYWLSDNEKAGYWGKMILDYEGRGGEVMPKMMDDGKNEGLVSFTLDYFSLCYTYI